MLLLVKLNPGILELSIRNSQSHLELSLFLLAAKKNAIIVSFW